MAAVADSNDEFKLNMSYITDRVVVMANFYEDELLNEVRSFLQLKHYNRHMIFNLANEQEFNIEHDLDNVRNYPFNANNPCALKSIIAFCTEVEAYLSAHPGNVVILHCRTGTVFLQLFLF
jgi:hypothetical protein